MINFRESIRLNCILYLTYNKCFNFKSNKCTYYIKLYKIQNSKDKNLKMWTTVKYNKKKLTLDTYFFLVDQSLYLYL